MHQQKQVRLLRTRCKEHLAKQLEVVARMIIGWQKRAVNRHCVLLDHALRSDFPAL